MEKSGIFIQFSYNEKEIVGIEEFKKDLDDSYLFLSNAKYFPSFTSGGEFWLKVFFGGSFWDFAISVIQAIIVDGVVRNGKKYVLAPLFDALRKLRKVNNKHWGLNMQTTTLLFDDFQVVIGGFQEYSSQELVILFKKIAEVKEFIYKCGGMALEKIELPCRLFDYGEFWSIDKSREPDCYIDKCIWRLTYEDGVVLFYDSEKGSFIECEEHQ